ncbi:hypothetical protein A1O3_07169 [Capronia epimyces CBS 606.96]|uniref:Zn(2)-C6 fungal-type domain-containing protein n=1 Tax=Capronia epimyces CBS 606.96 TaxID=1182542 RepID=W9XK66_9EURO|nr:uncharacterized protein A1O3_07169 [Capronia epimyces CBS 606.96]EXJ80882.1 hypothetical protein A1O3_07169 [Capronia epimyces CBS 606.96]
MAEDVMEGTSPAPAPAPAPESPSAAGKPAVKHRRTRAGCLCCRLRKKKCDERMPTCQACERNYLICTWPPPKPSRKRGSHSAGDGGGNDSRNPAALSPGNSTQGSSTLDINEDRRRNNDDLNNRAFSVNPALSSRLVVSPSLQAMNMVLASPSHGVLYQHYLKRTANAVSAWQDQTNPFIRFMMPMAVSDDLLFQSIMALSGAHFSQQPHASVEAKSWASTHETLAIRGLKFRLTRQAAGQDDALALLATTLVLCLLETMKGSSNSNAFLHLKGARALLSQWISTPPARSDPEIRSFIVELYLYFVILASTPLGPESHHLIVQDALTFFPYLKNRRYPGPLLGCAYELFELIPQVFKLAKERADEVKMGIPLSPQTVAAFEGVLAKILAWTPPADAANDYVRCGRIYHQALLVFLFTSFVEFDNQPVNLDELVGQAFEVLREELGHLPLGAPIATTLNWPLAVLGSCSKLPEHQDLIRRRLQDLCDRLQIPCFGQILHILEVLWKSSLPLRGMSSFEAVMKQLNMIVLIS